MNLKIYDENTKALYQALISLKTEEECGAFLEDLCTITEIKSMAQRLEVARMLDKKEIYSEIAQKTGASTATISRVSRSLNYGTDGYKLVISRLKNLQQGG